MKNINLFEASLMAEDITYLNGLKNQIRRIKEDAGDLADVTDEMISPSPSPSPSSNPSRADLVSAINFLITKLGLIVKGYPEGIPLKGTKTNFTIQAPNNDRFVQIDLFLALADEYYPDVYTDVRNRRDVIFGNFKFEFKELSASKGNKGHAFELLIVENLEKKDYSSRALTALKKCLAEEVGIDLPTAVRSIEHVGGANTPRPLDFKTGISLPKGVAPGDYVSIGKALSDINLHLFEPLPVEGDILPLSLKTGGTVTLINAGVITGGWENNVSDFLNMLGGVNTEKVIQGFDDYNPNKKGKAPLLLEALDLSTFNEENLKIFLKHAFGAGYVMLHDNHALYITEDLISQIITNLTPLGVAYPAVHRKRLDIVFANKYLKIKINIRNKQGGITPSHIMSDYILNWKNIL